MSTTWYAPEPPAPPPPLDGAAKWRIARRAGPLALFLLLCLALLLLVRLVERLLCGLRRPVTPIFQRQVCRAFFRLSGIRLKVTGTPMRDRGAMVSNHVSWLDIFTLSAPRPVFFVSKSEVRSWPGIGFLARAAGTVFITRKRGDAKAQQDVFLNRLRAGQRLMFFPEGTSTDGKRVLPFKTTLFAAFFAPELRDFCHVQPVTLLYRGARRRGAAVLRMVGRHGLRRELPEDLRGEAPGRGRGDLSPAAGRGRFRRSQGAGG